MKLFRHGNTLLKKEGKAVEDRRELGRKAFELGLGLGGPGPVLIGACGGTLALALARSVGCGVALAGGEAKFHDGSCEACGVWLAGYYGLPATVFVRQTGGAAAITVRDAAGREVCPCSAGTPAPCTGRWDLLTGADGGWAARRAGERCPPAVVAAQGPAALRLLLERMGCDVLDRPREGVPLLSGDAEGFCLTVCQNGVTLHPSGRDALDAAANWLRSSCAVPAFSPEVI